jgi:hypothetical protein
MGKLLSMPACSATRCMALRGQEPGTSYTDGSVIIQTTSRSVPSTPSWFGEVALIVEHLRQQGVLSAICERVRFARRRFGHYEVIDFLAVQIALRPQR